MYSSNVDRILFALHIFAVVVAFAPAVVHPLLARQYAQSDSPALQRLVGFMTQNGRRVYAPALILAGLFGILLVAVDDNELWDWDQTWINLALVIWIAMNAVVHAMILPGERRVAAGDLSAMKRVDTGGMLVSLLFVLMLYNMIWKPGL